MSRRVVEFTGGKHCEDCDEQIPPRRVMAFPKATRCGPCQSAQDRRILQAVDAAGEHGIVIIRG